MHTVIMLVWLASADAPQARPAPAHPAPAPVVAHGSCDNCCESGGHKLFGRLRGLFHRGCDDGCRDCSGHALFHRRHQDDCCNGGGHGLFGFLRRGHGDCCEERGHPLIGRFRNAFRKHDDCCQPDCCHGAAPGVIQPHAAPGQGGEKIGPPKESKKVPEAEKKAEVISPLPRGLTLDRAPALNPNR